MRGRLRERSCGAEASGQRVVRAPLEARRGGSREEHYRDGGRGREAEKGRKGRTGLKKERKAAGSGTFFSREAGFPENKQEFLKGL